MFENFLGLQIEMGICTADGISNMWIWPCSVFTVHPSPTLMPKHRHPPNVSDLGQTACQARRHLQSLPGGGEGGRRLASTRGTAYPLDNHAPGRPQK